jgi:SnoaL-like domain
LTKVIVSASFGRRNYLAGNCQWGVVAMMMKSVSGRSLTLFVPLKADEGRRQKTEEQTMANQGISTTVDGYFAMWNETDYDRRQAVIAATWSDDARYVDPLASAQGADGLHALVAGVHEQFPGHQFRLTGAVDTHHDCAHWDWELVAPDTGRAIARGVDFAVITADGRLRAVTGFLYQVPGAL